MTHCLKSLLSSNHSLSLVIVRHVSHVMCHVICVQMWYLGSRVAIFMHFLLYAIQLKDFYITLFFKQRCILLQCPHAGTVALNGAVIHLLLMPNKIGECHRH